MTKPRLVRLMAGIGFDVRGAAAGFARAQPALIRHILSTGIADGRLVGCGLNVCWRNRMNVAAAGFSRKWASVVRIVARTTRK